MRKSLRALAVVAAALSASACITVGGGPPDTAPDRFHVMELDPAPDRTTVMDLGAAPKAQPGAPAAKHFVIEVRPFRAAGRLTKNVLRREGPSRVAPVPGEYWADEPAAAVTEVAGESLARLLPSAGVVDAFTALKRDVTMDGVVTDCCVETPSGGRARAVVRLRLTWYSSNAFLDSPLYATTAVEGSEEIPGPGLDGLGAAMARAVDQAVRKSVPPAVAAAAAPAAR